MQKIRFLLTLSVLIFGFLHSANAYRVGFNYETWQTYETEHFKIIYSAQQQDLGRYYSNIAEDAYQKLATLFQFQPSKIVVVINDSTDAANGYATVVPYPLIMIYPVQTQNEGGLAEAGEWAKELFTHELTHIFQLYPANGFYNYLFQK